MLLKVALLDVMRRLSLGNKARTQQRYFQEQASQGRRRQEEEPRQRPSSQFENHLLSLEFLDEPGGSGGRAPNLKE